MGRPTLALGLFVAAGCGRLGIDPTAPIDAIAGGDTAAGGYCATLAPSPLFCADFDDDPGFSAWSSVSSPAPLVDATDARSDPNALSCAVSASGARTVELKHGFSQNLTRWSSSVDIEVLAFNSTQFLDLTGFSLGSGHGAYVTIDDAGTHFTEAYPNGNSTSYRAHAMSFGLTIGTWSRLRVELQLVPPATASVYLDGVAVLLDEALDASWGFAPVVVGVGIQYAPRGVRRRCATTTSPSTS